MKSSLILFGGSRINLGVAERYTSEKISKEKVAAILREQKHSFAWAAKQMKVDPSGFRNSLDNGTISLDRFDKLLAVLGVTADAIQDGGEKGLYLWVSDDTHARIAYLAEKANVSIEAQVARMAMDRTRKVTRETLNRLRKSESQGVSQVAGNHG